MVSGDNDEQAVTIVQATVGADGNNEAHRDLKKHLKEGLIFDIQHINDLHAKAGMKFAPSGIARKSGGVRADTSVVTHFIVKATNRLLKLASSRFLQGIVAQANPMDKRFSTQNQTDLSECFGIQGNAERQGAVRTVVEEIVNNSLDRCKADLLQKLTAKDQVKKLVREMFKTLSDQKKMEHQSEENTARLQTVRAALGEHVRSLSHADKAEDDSWQHFFDLLQENQGRQLVSFSRHPNAPFSAIFLSA